MAILLGSWRPGVTCHVGADGFCSSADPALDGIEMYRLSAAEASAMIAALDEARGQSEEEAAAHGKHAKPGHADAVPLPPHAHPSPAGASTAAHASAADSEALPPPGTAATSADRLPRGHEPQPPGRPTQSRPDAPTAGTGTGSVAGTRRIVHVEVLGPLRITAAGQEIGGGLRKARELIAFLAVHPGGASADAISGALWPDASPEHASGQRNLALRKARNLLRAATGMAAPMWIIHSSRRYRLDPNLISTDLWQFTAALDQARHAATDQARLAAWQEAAALYRGELAEGESYDWAESFAETARRRALDAWTAIADIFEPRNLGQALAALETALGYDPYNEFLYQKIMRLQAAVGHLEAVRRTLTLLESRLAELGLTPGAQTGQVAASLLSGSTAGRRRSGESAGY